MVRTVRECARPSPTNSRADAARGHDERFGHQLVDERSHDRADVGAVVRRRVERGRDRRDGRAALERVPDQRAGAAEAVVVAACRGGSSPLRGRRSRSPPSGCSHERRLDSIGAKLPGSEPARPRGPRPCRPDAGRLRRMSRRSRELDEPEAGTRSRSSSSPRTSRRASAASRRSSASTSASSSTAATSSTCSRRANRATCPRRRAGAGAAVHRVPMHSPLYRQDVSRITQVRTRSRPSSAALAPDLLHVHMADGSVFFHTLTAAAYSGPTVVTMHSALAAAERARARRLHRVLTSAEWVTGCSQSMLDQTRRVVPAIMPRSSVVLNGMDTGRISASPLPFDPPCVLLLGRLVVEKGFDVALRACVDVVARVPGVRILVVGDGPARADLLVFGRRAGAHRRGRVARGGARRRRAPCARHARRWSPCRRATRNRSGSWPSKPVWPDGPSSPAPWAACRRWSTTDEPVCSSRPRTRPRSRPPSCGCSATVSSRWRWGAAGRARAELDFALDRHVDAFEAIFERLIGAAPRVRPGATA